MFKGLLGKKRVLTLFTLMVSIFGVIVGGVSTAAWFEITTGEHTLGNLDNNIVSGTSDVEITGVTGYKYTYDELGNNNIDYLNGHVTAYTIYGENSDTTFDGNIHQGDITSLDVPEEGIGYYIVGNEKFCELNGFDTANAWSYSASIRLDNDSSILTSDNQCRLLNTILYSTSYDPDDEDLEHVEFKIRHHYITDKGTQDEWMAADNKVAEGTELFIDVHNGNWRLKNGCSGKYDIYLNHNFEIALVRKGDVPQVQSQSAHKSSPATKAYTAGQYVFLSPGVWNNDGTEHMCVIFRDGGSDEGSKTHDTVGYNYSDWIHMQQLESTGVFYKKMPTDQTWTYVRFLRVNPNKDDSTGVNGNYWIGHSADHHGVYNCTNWIPLSSVNTTTSNCYTISGWGSAWYNCPGSLGPASTPVLSAFTDTFEFRDALDGWKSETLTVTKDFIPNNTTITNSTVTFTTDTDALKLRQDSQFKFTRNDNIWMGYNFFDPKPTSPATYSDYFYGTTDSGNGSNITILKNCKCTVTFTHFFSDGGWSYKIVPTDFSPSYFTINIYKKNYSTGSLTFVEDMDINIDDYEPTDDYTLLDPIDDYGCSTITGYSTWINKWYSAATCAPQEEITSAHGGAGTSSRTNVYTYFTADTTTVNLTVSYLDAGGDSIDVEKTAAQSEDDRSDSTQHVDTIYTFPAPVTPAANYTFVGYNTLANGKGTSFAQGNTYGLDTSASHTFYAIYKPVECVVQLTYQHFNVDGTSFGSLPTGKTIEDDVAYKTLSYMPANPSSIDKYWDSATGTYYIFDWDGYWYTDSDCDVSHRYTATAPTGNLHLYAKMVAKETTIIYIDTSNVSWTSPYIRVFNDYDGLNHAHHQIPSGNKVFSNNSTLYFVNIPTDTNYSLIVTSGGNYGDHVQTVNINLGSNDSLGNPRNGGDFVYVSSAEEGKHKQFTWAYFYGKPENGDSATSDGYYLVGIIDGGTSTWTFESGSAWKMDELTSEEKTQYNIPDYDYAIGLENGFNIAKIEKFQIWQYDHSIGRRSIFDWSKVSNDTETRGIAESDGSDIKIKSSVSGNKFAIFLDVDGGSNCIFIQDREKTAELYFSNVLETYSTSVFKLGHGDFDNNDTTNSSRTAVYEKGIYISQEDLDNNNGKISFIIRCKNRGSYKWYCYNGLNGSGTDGSGVDGEILPAYLEVGDYAGELYGDIDSEADRAHSSDSYKMYAINRVGYYSIYVLENGKIAVEEIPAEYGEGFYIMPSSSNLTPSGDLDNKGYNDGKKMKVLTNSDNVALFTCYAANSTIDNMTIYIRGFLGGKDYGLVTTPGDNVYDGALATFNAETDEITFNNPGSYNIYVYRAPNGGYGVSITEYTSEQFFSMNSIRRSATAPTAEYVKKANTSFILKVDFDLRNEGGFTSKACVDKIVSGTGIGNSLVYTYAVNPTIETNSNCYDYMRDNYYDSLSDDDEQESSEESASISTGSHTLYILIDYNPNYVNTLDFEGNSLNNNFFFVIRLKQEV